MTKHSTKQGYSAPRTEYGPAVPELLCQSLVDGSIEDVGEEDWTF